MIVRKNHSNLWGMKGMTVKQLDFVLVGGESSFPCQGSNPCPLLWMHVALTTALPGKSLKEANFDYNIASVC